MISKYLTIYVGGWVCVGCGFDNFIFVVPVSIGGSASANAKDVFYLTTRSQPLNAIITGGSEQFIGVDQVFLLDASSSVDPDRSDEEIYYTWKCQVLAAFFCSFVFRHIFCHIVSRDWPVVTVGRNRSTL